MRLVRIIQLFITFAIFLAVAGTWTLCASAAENLHGPAVLYHPNGRVWIEGTFDNGRLSGKWTEYYDNGQIRRTGAAYGSVHGPNRLEDPLKTGPWVEYYPDGTLRFEGTYFDDLLVGRAVQYERNGRLKYEGYFENGRLAGKWTEYWTDGFSANRVRETGEAYGSARGLNSLEEPLRTGPWTRFHRTGAVEFEGTYENNLLEGPAVKYHPRGAKAIEGTFVNGQLKGTWTAYGVDGSVLRTGEAYGSAALNSIEEPLKTGPWFEYAPTGYLEFEGLYENNLLVYGRLYDGNGTLRREATFQEGRAASWAEYDAHGQVRALGGVNGTLSGELNDIRGIPVRHGPWFEYSPAGVVVFQATYENNRLTGRAVAFNVDGTPAFEAVFKDGMYAGTWISYHWNGRIAYAGEAHGGPARTFDGLSLGSSYYFDRGFDYFKEGPWVEYNPQGTVIFEGTYVNNLLHGYAAGYAGGGLPSSSDQGMGTLVWEAEFEHGYPVGFVRVYGAGGRLVQMGEAAVLEPVDRILPCCGEWWIRKGLWFFYRDDGSLERVAYYDEGPAMPVQPVKDPNTGVDRYVVNRPGGSRVLYDVWPDGTVGVRRDLLPDLLPFDLDEVVDYEYDPQTGELRIVRKSAGGALVASAGRRFMDEEGNERISEADERGHQSETVISPDGSTRISVTGADGKEASVSLDPVNGLGVTAVLPDGSRVRTTYDPWKDAIVTETLGPDGLPVDALIQRPEGWIEEIAGNGNLRTWRLNPDGSTTVIELDRNGNVVATRIGPDGEVIEQERVLAGPREPGRDYFERVLGGTGWDGLPPGVKRHFADAEQALLGAVLSQPGSGGGPDPRGLGDEPEELGRTGQPDQFGRMSPEERRRAIEAARERARELQREYDAAVARGDLEEARRIMALQDEHEAATMELLMPTEEEMREMERLSEVRRRLMTEINEAALRRAQLDLFVAERARDRKDAVTSKTQILSIGSQMQQETSATTRQAERERILARAKIEEIDMRLQQGGLSDEERRILLEARELMVLQEEGASELLAANGRITAAGYLTDIVTTVTGVGVVSAAGRAGARAVTGLAARLGSESVATAAETAVARVSALASTDVLTPALSAMGSAARRVVGETVADATSSAARGLWEIAQADVTDLGTKLAGVVRRAPDPVPSGTGAAVVAPEPVYKTPAERSATVLENAPLENPRARVERLKTPSEMTPAERQAYHDQLWQDFWNRVRRGEINPDYADDWDDVLIPIGPDHATTARPFTREEVARLHQPGRELTPGELMRKAEIYRARHEAAYFAQAAESPAERLAYAQRLVRINSVLDEFVSWEPRPGARPGAGAGPAGRAGAVEPPDWMTAPTAIIDPPPRFSSANAGRSTEIFEPLDFPPVREEAIPPASFTPPPPPPPPLPPLKTGVSPDRPTIEWPVGPYIHGLPGPGVGQHHIEAARRLANETGVPVVIHGSRQTGFSYHTGKVWRIDTDLDLGAVGPPEAFARLLRYEPEKMDWIPDILHSPMYRWDTIADALRQGLLVVSPER